MSSHTAKAYVEIERNNSQDLILALAELDYKNSAYHPSDVVWFVENGYFYSRDYTTESEEERFIDCNAYTPNGTEEEVVRLFLELAQMDDDDASTLWIECEGKIVKTYFSLIDRIEKCVTLSPLEVAQAFKERRIVL